MERFFKHLFFWSIILLWMNPVFNSKGLYAWEFLQFNLVRLPLIAASTYLLIYYLLPVFLFEQRDYKKFGLAFSCLFIATNLLDRWLIGTSLIDSIMGNTGLHYTFFNGIPMFRNAFLLLAIMGLASIHQLIRRQNQLEMQLAQVHNNIPLPPFPTSSNDNEDKEYFYLKSGNTNHKLKWDNILYLEKDENYVVYHTIDKKFLERTTLAKVGKKTPQNFIRIHRSFIISTKMIEQLGSDYLIINKRRIPIGRKYGKTFLKMMKSENLIFNQKET